MLLSTYCKDLIILWFVHFLSNNEGSFISVCGSLPIFRSTSHTRPSITIRRTGGSVGRRRRSICLRLNKISDQFRPPFDVRCLRAWLLAGESAAGRRPGEAITFSEIIHHVRGEAKNQKMIILSKVIIPSVRCDDDAGGESPWVRF